MASRFVFPLLVPSAVCGSSVVFGVNTRIQFFFSSGWPLSGHPLSTKSVPCAANLRLALSQPSLLKFVLTFAHIRFGSRRDLGGYTVVYLDTIVYSNLKHSSLVQSVNLLLFMLVLSS